MKKPPKDVPVMDPAAPDAARMEALARKAIPAGPMTGAVGNLERFSVYITARRQLDIDETVIEVPLSLLSQIFLNILGGMIVPSFRQSEAQLMVPTKPTLVKEPS